MMTSGSCLRIERSAFAKVMSIRALTCVWPIPSRSYSIGSSTVITLTVEASIRFSAEYSVVLLPEPVGPVTSTMPCGWCTSRSKVASVCGDMPSLPRSSRPASFSSSRSTARSPCPVGSVETRTSTGRPPMRSVIRPSWGSRFSAMSSCAMILMRDTSAACSSRRGRTTSRSVPSTLNRTCEYDSKGSMWMSEAPSRAAWVSSALIIRMIGASSSVSSRSSIFGMSCSSRDRSRSLSTSSTTEAAEPSCCA
jgi:hypothetical protein